MTEQEEKQYLFDKSLNHIKAQGKPSALPSGACQYKEGDCGCAAAPFITEYKPEMEGHGFIGLIRHYKDCLNPMAVKHCSFVSDLQSAHDRSVGYPINNEGFMKDYLYNMKRIAKNENLTFVE